MSLEVELNAGEVSKYRRHENGKGFVSPGARVNSSAFVSSAAYVESGAQVGAGSWIGQGSWIDHRAIIGAELLEAQQGLILDAPLCMSCGTAMRPSGSCYVCESCGSTSGCS